MTIIQVLQSTGLPACYNAFKEPKEPPFLVYIGAGQAHFYADTKVYNRKNAYQVEYYFKDKDPATENLIEEAFINDGWTFTKGDDTPVDSEGTMVIFYDVMKIGKEQ